jgi:cyclopropane fatty-acyl-phospholipid synthase-like methyltransferase
MTTRIAPRFQWAVNVLPVRPTDHLLEVGCGHGIALSMVAERLKSGRILGIDRSAKMIAAASKRNAAAIAAGKVMVRTGTFDKVDLGADPFDSVLAINVILFARDAAGELARIRERLKRRGRLYLFYESPSRVHSRAFLVDGGATLAKAGFVVTEGPDQSIGASLIARLA